MPETLDRFITAQDQVWPAVTAELAAGQKRSHWTWFVFPQLAGLGQSPMAVRYALASVDEARAYLAHPVLSARLREVVDLMLLHRERDAEAILGSVDAMKFRSSMSLFAAADPQEPRFAEALSAFFAGAPDPKTVELIGGAGCQD
jgi:uncharacterized protein (DUF1810 family)